VAAAALQLVHQGGGHVEQAQPAQALPHGVHDQVHGRVLREPVSDHIGHRVQRGAGRLAGEHRNEPLHQRSGEPPHQRGGNGHDFGRLDGRGRPAAQEQRARLPQLGRDLRHGGDDLLGRGLFRAALQRLLHQLIRRQAIGRGEPDDGIDRRDRGRRNPAGEPRPG